MPEITPELIKKHFRCPDCRPEFWEPHIEKAVSRDVSWLSLVMHESVLCGQRAVESLILRLDAAEKRIEELEEETVQLKARAIKASK